MQLNKIKLLIKEKIEKVLLEIGFIEETVRLESKTIDGKEELKCYKFNEMYCLLSFIQHKTTSGIMKDWVLIEYADGIQEASKWMFEDGDMIPLDLPIEQIIREIKEEVINVIKSEK